MVLWIVLSIVVVMAIVGIVFVNQPSFGRIPRGERLARIERSPNYRDGAFRSQKKQIEIKKGMVCRHAQEKNRTKPASEQS